MDVQPEIFYLPPYSFFESGNIYTGSHRTLSYKVTMTEEEMVLQIWHSRLCSDKAVIEGEYRFPKKENSIQEIKKILESKRETA